METNDIIIFGLLAVGLYLICTINNDNCTVKNSGTVKNVKNIQNVQNVQPVYNTQKLPNNIPDDNYDIKPNDDNNNNFNAVFDNNYSLGVDINDPSNMKYKL